MTKDQFTDNFKLLLVHLKEVTENLCLNTLSENYLFLLEPSGRNESTHLSEIENGYLKKWNTLENTEISFDEVINLLYKNGQTPTWADCNVYLSTRNKTVVKIFFSRQFKDDDAIYYLERGTGPFKAVVHTQFNNSENQGNKLDVNWKYNLDQKKSSTFFSKIRQFLFNKNE